MRRGIPLFFKKTNSFRRLFLVTIVAIGVVVWFMGSPTLVKAHSVSFVSVNQNPTCEDPPGDGSLLVTFSTDFVVGTGEEFYEPSGVYLIISGTAGGDIPGGSGFFIMSKTHENINAFRYVKSLNLTVPGSYTWWVQLVFFHGPGSDIINSSTKSFSTTVCPPPPPPPKCAPPGSGDWTITSYCEVNNKNYTVNGKIIIQSGGILGMKGTSNIILSPSPGYIHIYPGGKIYIQDNATANFR